MTCPVIRELIYEPRMQAFKYLWLMHVAGVRLDDAHCQACLIGARNREVGTRHIKNGVRVFHDVTLDRAQGVLPLRRHRAARVGQQLPFSPSDPPRTRGSRPAGLACASSSRPPRSPSPTRSSTPRTATPRGASSTPVATGGSRGSSPTACTCHPPPPLAHRWRRHDPPRDPARPQLHARRKQPRQARRPDPVLRAEDQGGDLPPVARRALPRSRHAPRHGAPGRPRAPDDGAHRAAHRLVPDAWHFNPDRLKAPLRKRRVLHDAIVPLVGADASFLAIESNPFTTQMYRGEGIETVKCYPADDLKPWASLPPVPAPPIKEPC